MRFIVNVLLKIPYIGIMHSDNFQRTKRIILLNYLCIWYMLIPLPYIGFYIWMNMPIFAGLVPIIVSFFSIALWLNAKGKQYYGALWLMLSILVAVSVFSSIFGAQAGFQYVLFPLFMTPSILLGDQAKRTTYTVMMMIVSVYFFLEATQYWTPYRIQLSLENAQMSRFMLISDAFIIMGILLHFKYQMMNQVKMNLHHYLAIYKLTPRESEIVIEICRGHNNRQVAESLFIEAGTVKTHLNNIFKKLNIKSRAELVALTYRS